MCDSPDVTTTHLQIGLTLNSFTGQVTFHAFVGHRLMTILKTNLSKNSFRNTISVSNDLIWMKIRTGGQRFGLKNVTPSIPIAFTFFSF